MAVAIVVEEAVKRLNYFMTGYGQRLSRWLLGLMAPILGRTNQKVYAHLSVSTWIQNKSRRKITQNGQYLPTQHTTCRMGVYTKGYIRSPIYGSKLCNPSITGSDKETFQSLQHSKQRDQSEREEGTGWSGDQWLNAMLSSLWMDGISLIHVYIPRKNPWCVYGWNTQDKDLCICHAEKVWILQ